MHTKTPLILPSTTKITVKLEKTEPVNGEDERDPNDLVRPIWTADNQSTSALQSPSNFRSADRESEHEPKCEPSPVLFTAKTENYKDSELIFIKDEDDNWAWNLEALGLGPVIKVEDARVNSGWTRKEIGDAFGGNTQDSFHNWYGDATWAAKGTHTDLSQNEPYIAFNRKMNPQLPITPGQHGIVICVRKEIQHFNDGTVIERPVAFFTGEGANDWRLSGDYLLKASHKILPEEFDLLPSDMITSWIKGISKSDWGKGWVQSENDKISQKIGYDPELVICNPEGIRKALSDGRLALVLTTIQCVGYRTEMLDQLEYYRKNPKASKSRKEVKGTRGRDVAKEPESKTPKEQFKVKRSRRIAQAELDSEHETSVKRVTKRQRVAK